MDSAGEGSTGDESTGPAAFNPARLHWEDLPPQTVALIEERAGWAVASATSVTQGFSPGFAGTLVSATGEAIFVKAVSAAQNPDSVKLAQAEANACTALPPDVAAPHLMWSHFDDWSILAFERVQGAPPQLPWREQDLALAMSALESLAECRPNDGHALEPLATKHWDLFTNWRTYAELPDAERDHTTGRLGEWGPWVERHLESLLTWDAQGPEATAGDRLAHCDLRADNMIVDGERVWLVDWPHATIAAPWVDLAAMLPSVQMQGGGTAQELFASHPLSKGVEHEQLRAWVAAFAGFFLLGAVQPPPENIPTLRAFQWGQAMAAVDWLCALEPTLRA